MRFFDEMTTKFGFAGGEAVVPGAKVFRRVYVETINALAERNGSQFRAIAYDRGGMHNEVLILFARLADLEGFDPSFWWSGTLVDEGFDVEKTTEDYDEAMTQAIHDAHDLELQPDELVEVKVVVDEEAFAVYLENIEEQLAWRQRLNREAGDGE